jgi:bone morphogenetic protein receptor type-2
MIIFRGSSHAKKIFFLGCWDTSGKPNECDRPQCLAENKPPKAMNNTKFCCCSEDMCNVNFTDAYVPAEDFPPSTTELAPKKSVKSFIWIGAVVSFIIITIIALPTSYYLWKKKPKKSDVESCQQHPVPSSADYSLDKLKLLNVIGTFFN